MRKVCVGVFVFGIFLAICQSAYSADSSLKPHTPGHRRTSSSVEPQNDATAALQMIEQFKKGNTTELDPSVVASLQEIQQQYLSDQVVSFGSDNGPKNQTLFNFQTQLITNLGLLAAKMNNSPNASFTPDDQPHLTAITQLQTNTRTELLKYMLLDKSQWPQYLKSELETAKKNIDLRILNQWNQKEKDCKCKKGEDCSLECTAEKGIKFNRLEDIRGFFTPEQGGTRVKEKETPKSVWFAGGSLFGFGFFGLMTAWSKWR